MSGDLRTAAAAAGIGRATMADIRRNPFRTFAYDVALIPVAARILRPVGGTPLSPMPTAGAMGPTGPFVLANAVRLRRLRPAATTAREERR